MEVLVRSGVLEFQFAAHGYFGVRPLVTTTSQLTSTLERSLAERRSRMRIPVGISCRGCLGCANFRRTPSVGSRAYSED